MTKDEAIKILELTRDGYLEKAQIAWAMNNKDFGSMFHDKVMALNVALYELGGGDPPTVDGEPDGIVYESEHDATEAAMLLKSFCEGIEDCDECVFSRDDRCRLYNYPEGWLLRDFETPEHLSKGRKQRIYLASSVAEIAKAAKATKKFQDLLAEVERKLAESVEVINPKRTD